jgi:hypothetical protein
VAPPRVRDGEAVEQLAAGEAEEVADRTGMAESHQRRVDVVLQRRAMADQVQPKARKLALAANAGIGQPDRRHQVAL